MVYTFKELRDMALRVVGEDGDTVTETMLKDVMNQAHVNRLKQHKWPFMRWPRTETLSITSGTRDYTLHQEYGQGLDFYDVTNGRHLKEVPYREELDLVPEGDDADGTPWEFQLAGNSPVQTQLTSNDTIKVVSTSASDNTSTYNIIITGETSSGDITSETVTPNGLTPVAGTVTWRTILGVTKTADTNGSISVTTSGGTTILTLRPTENGRNYRVLHLLRDPDASATVKYRFMRKVTELVNDYDIPLLPDEHALILVYDALLLMAGAMRTITSSQIQEWKEVQARLERNLYREYGFDQSTLNAAPTYIRWTGDY